MALIVATEATVATEKENNVNVDAFTPHYEDLLQDQNILPFNADFHSAPHDIKDEFLDLTPDKAPLRVEVPEEVPLIANIHT